MDGPPATSNGGGGGGGGGGGPAPFLLKTYEMVDDSATDEIVSWSSSKNSFVVWNPPEFARLLLPTYFKHNNFSSFIRQLNTYGFRKIDPERWEFGNEEFVKDQKHLLKNIHRRKPIHSHSSNNSSMVDPERAAFEEEIERLSREKAVLKANIVSYEHQRSGLKLQLEEATQRMDNMEKRQGDLLKFLETATQNPIFVQYLARKVESMDISGYKKKRRLPETEPLKTFSENGHLDNNSSSGPEFRNIFHQTFSNKLRLELSPAVSDMNLVSHSRQSSNDDERSPQSQQRKISEEGDPLEVQGRTEGLSFAPETLELSDSGSFPCRRPVSEALRLHSLNPEMSSLLDVDAHISCHLNLSLASFSFNENLYPARIISQQGHEVGQSPESMFDVNTKEPEPADTRGLTKRSEEHTNLSTSVENQNNNQRPTTATTKAVPVRVNDVFWEQYLTERPGSQDNEEACSTYRAIPYEEQDGRRLGHGLPPRNNQDTEQLTL